MRQRHVLQDYFEIIDEQLLHAARAALGRINRDLAVQSSDADDAILSSLVHALPESTARGAGTTSNPTVKALYAYQHEMLRMATERRAAEANRAVLMSYIRDLELVIETVEMWLELRGSTPFGNGNLTFRDLFNGYHKGLTCETLSIRAGYKDESMARMWLCQVDRDLRHKMSFGVPIHNNRIPSYTRFKRETGYQLALVY